MATSLMMSAVLGLCGLVLAHSIELESCTAVTCGSEGGIVLGSRALLQVRKGIVETQTLEKSPVSVERTPRKKEQRIAYLNKPTVPSTDLAINTMSLQEQTPDLSSSGAAAPLNEAGYQSVASMCCPMEAMAFGQRVVFNLGFELCATGDLVGLMEWFYCSKQNQTYDNLVTEILENFWGPYYGVSCAWVAWPGQCKEKAGDCPKYNASDGVARANVIGTRGTCCYPSAATALEFSGSTLTSNNLGGKGPNFGDAQELRYQGAGAKNARSFDLVVTAEGDYNPGNSNGANNGISGKFGNIQVWAGTSVDLTFSLQDSVTKAPVVLKEFYFSFLDLDEEQSRIRERVLASDFVDRVLEPVNDLEEVEMPDGRTRYESTVTAGGWNNPTDPMVLGIVTNPSPGPWTGPTYQDQRKQALMFIYRETSFWKLTLEVTHAAGTPHGRNFVFGGTSALLDICPRRQEPNATTVSGTF